MERPKITYHILGINNVYEQKDSVYAGTYTGEEPISVNLRIWNNYRGVEDVEDLEHFNIVLRFLTKEDNALLPYLVTEITNKEALSIVVEEDAAVFNFSDPVILSGQANTGSAEYTKNYIDITVSFNAPDNVYLKDHDLKSLIIEIVEL